jgi:hypothetical protein
MPHTPLQHWKSAVQLWLIVLQQVPAVASQTP